MSSFTVLQENVVKSLFTLIQVNIDVVFYFI